MPLPSILRFVGWDFKVVTFAPDATGVWVSVAEDGYRCWPRSLSYRLSQWHARGWRPVSVVEHCVAHDAVDCVTVVLRRSDDGEAAAPQTTTRVRYTDQILTRTNP